MDHANILSGGTATRSDRAGETLAIIEHEIRRLAEEGPTQEELDKAKAYLKGSYALGFDTSGKIAGQLVQIQLDKLGIDYPERRGAMIDAVTLERRQARRQAPARHQGAHRGGRPRAGAEQDQLDSRKGMELFCCVAVMLAACRSSMTSRTRAPRRSARTASRKRRSTTRSTRSEAALDWAAQAHADGTLPLLRLPARTDDLDDDQARGRAAARGRDRRGGARHRRLEPRRADAGAACRTSACAASRRFAAAPRMHFMDNLDPATYGALLDKAAARDHALHRDLEIRRHRRNADADRGRALGRQAGWTCERVSANCSSASARA